MKIRWTDNAVKDLNAIYNFYAYRSVRVAIKLYNRILDETYPLSSFPQLAPIEPILSEKTETFRSLVVASGRYKVIYYIKNNQINITHVWDCRKRPENLK